MRHVTIIATSFNEDSKSQRLARIFQSKLEESSISNELIDLRELSDFDFAGKPGSWNSKSAEVLRKGVEQASHIVFAVPIYCYDVNSAAKNVIELIGKSFVKKIVGFMCSAGGSGSYMSVMHLANHLMLDFRSIIVPRFLYVTGAEWLEKEGETPRLDDKILKRISQLVEDLSEINEIA